MFSDKLATPTRVETLLDLLRCQPKRRWTETHIAQLLQPAELPGIREGSKQAGAMVVAAAELGLVERGKESIRLTFKHDDPRDSRAILCSAVDERVLGSIEIEPYFGPFYSFLLGQGRRADEHVGRNAWVTAFGESYAPAKGPNPFNETKLTGLRRWYSYVGLGWSDPRDVFQCDPYQRLLRRLPAIFEDDTELSASQFFPRLASACPELDGGEMYRSVVAGYAPGSRRCSLGLSRALIELHQDNVICLSCPTDSDGWWIDEADPPRDGAHIQSDRIDRITWVGRDGNVGQRKAS